ncbi:MAG TPA: cell division protein FtsA [Thermotogota bacterium]|nr:cell division protein FtsA [Thermotogota bacterium]HRW91393.1 cell division protein FtsA [Thermotogota bacterium]
MAESFEVLTVVDIGSFKLKGLVIELEPGRPHVEAHSTVTARGFEGGELKDIVALRESLETLVQDLSSQLTRKMESYFVISFSDRTTLLRESTYTIELSPGDPVPIREEHVFSLFDAISAGKAEKALEDESFELIGAARSILHVIPQNYILDGARTVLNPIEMEATSLGMTASIVSLDSTVKDSISNAFGGVVGEKPGVFSSSFVSAEVVLNTMEKERGVVCIDFGHSFTTVSAYLNGAIYYMKAIDQGIKHVVKDIAQVFHTSFDEAQRLMIQYGKVALKDKQNDSISYTLLDGKTNKQIARSQLSIVIYAKIREILNSIKREMRLITSKMVKEGEQGIPGGVVITGGGANIEGLVEFLRDSFKVQVRIGHVGTGSMEIQTPDETRSPIFSACFGNLHWYQIFGGGDQAEALPVAERKERKRKKSTPKHPKKQGPSTFEKIVEFLKKLV